MQRHIPHHPTAASNLRSVSGVPASSLPLLGARSRLVLGVVLGGHPRGASSGGMNGVMNGVRSLEITLLGVASRIARRTPSSLMRIGLHSPFPPPNYHSYDHLAFVTQIPSRHPEGGPECPESETRTTAEHRREGRSHRTPPHSHPRATHWIPQRRRAA